MNDNESSISVAKAWNTTFHKMASENIYYVVDNYYHALTARFPRHRSVRIILWFSHMRMLKMRFSIYNEC